MDKPKPKSKPKPLAKRIGQFLLPKRWHNIGAGIYWFGLKYQCPICGYWLRDLRPHRVHTGIHKDACFRCGSVARHRFIWLYLKNRSNLFTAPLKVLHFAAEPGISHQLMRLKNLDYVTADNEGGDTPGMEVLDLMDIRKPDETYDVVLCIHVLEHIEDDFKALREIFRILKPGGWAVLNPHMDLALEKTFEDPTVTDPRERRRLFHQKDHYRVYGRDMDTRFAKAGFEVEMIPYMEAIPAAQRKRYSLDTSGVIVFCRKPLRKTPV